MKHTALYRHFGSDGQLLYVGISLCVVARLAQHRTSPWFAEIATITVQHFPNREDAVAAEERAIRRERPKYNLTFQVPANAAELIERGKWRPTGFRLKHNNYYYDMGGKPRKWVPLGRVLHIALDRYNALRKDSTLLEKLYKSEDTSC